MLAAQRREGCPMNVVLKPEPRGSAQADANVSLLPTHPGSWTQYNFERLFQLSRKNVEDVQLAALQNRFAQLKDGVAALDRLAKKQGVARIDTISDVLPLLFDH